MSPLTLLPAQMAASVVSFALLVMCVLWPWLRTLTRERALLVLVWPQTLRHLGATMLSPFVANAALSTDFTHAVALGDAATMLFAGATVLALHRKSRAAIPLAWVTSLVGLADLLHNFVLARIHQVAPHLGPQWYVIAFGVPAMLVFHLAAITVLTRRASTH